MAIAAGKVKRVICAGIFKVLYHRNLVWKDIEDEDITVLFTSVTNPTSWPTFFLEAVATAIQQELVIRGSFCPNLESTFIQYEADSNTWTDLESFIQSNVRNSQATF